MNGEQYQAYVSQLVGYDAACMGQVQTLESAFGEQGVQALGGRAGAL